jgi:hypothetical protein
VDLERVLNEIGMCYLPYLEKGSTIGDAITWFEKVITALQMQLHKQTRISWFVALSGF